MLKSKGRVRPLLSVRNRKRTTIPGDIETKNNGIKELIVEVLN